MQIIATTEIAGHIVETDDPEEYFYIRFSNNDWWVKMGESLERVYDSMELEDQFKKFLK